MDRRSYLRRLAAATGTAALAGCSGALGDDGGPPNVTLSPPDAQGDPEAFAYPGYGQRVPDVALTDPITETEVDVRDVGTPYLLTFIFTHCRDVCPLLTDGLRQVQDDAAENGYADAVTFLDLTFDPERDDAERFREYAQERSVDPDAGNWHFLRAGGPERTRSVIADEHPDGFGVPYRRSDQGTDGTATGTDGTTDHRHTTTAGTGSGGDGGDGSDGGHHHEGYGFDHLSLVLLANGPGYARSTYPSPLASRISARWLYMYPSPSSVWVFSKPIPNSPLIFRFPAATLSGLRNRQ
jgi:protein SCO1/2